MKYLLEISATTDDLKDHLDVLSCFLHSASALFGITCDGASEKDIGGMNYGWNEHFITSFFLYRHAVELAIKALIKEIKNIDAYGHNIRKIWEDHIPDHQNVLSKEITKLFQVLEKYGLLEDAQLFRYHIDKNGATLESLPPIENADFDALSSAAWAIRHAVLERMHVRKGLSL